MNDAASKVTVLEVLEEQAAALDAKSELGAVFRDWADFLSGQPSPWALPWRPPR